jgi:hypothetical protein
MAGPFHENAPHRQSRCGKKMAAAIPLLRGPIAGHAHVRFVDESCGLEGLIPIALAGEAGLRKLPQFVIHFREQLPGRASRTIRIMRAGHGRAASL